MGPLRSANKSGKEDECGANEDYRPDVYFQPIVHLPDLEAIETGKESVEKLFNWRAKLFRHDQNTKD